MGAINDVASGESDFGIVRYQSIYEEYFLGSIQDRGLSQELVSEFTTVLLMSKDHPLASYENVSFHMLSGYPEIVQGDFKVPSVPLSQIQRGASFQSHAKRIYVYDRGSQYDILQRVPGSFMWVSPIPEEYLHASFPACCTGTLSFIPKGSRFLNTENALSNCCESLQSNKE